MVSCKANISDGNSISKKICPAAVELEMAERLAQEEVEDETVAFLAHAEEEEQITHQPSAFVRQAQKLTRLGRGPKYGEYSFVNRCEIALP